MLHLKASTLVFTLAPLSVAAMAQAQEAQPAGPQVTVVDPNNPTGAGMGGPQEPPPPENPIPPNVEGQAIPAQGGGYCFGGPHPAPGGGWEATTSPHVHDYAPFDLRLFSFHEGCYYFIGDPRDFGYTGESYSYYGAHPILDTYGGGWCFMIGAHSHWWRPWSPYFTVVGPWYYWNGPYDPFFWSYWPYYSFYYRSYYPSYYAGGRYFRTWRAAPAISRVPATGWRGGAAGGWRGTPANGASRSGVYSGGVGGAWRGNPGAYRAAPAAGGAWRGSPVPSTSSSLRSSPYSGGWRAPSYGGAVHPMPSTGGGWHAPAYGGGGGGFHPAPSTSSGWRFHGGGGGFRGGRR